MLRKFFPIDHFLKAITENSNRMNWFLLKINLYPQFLYGLEYKKKKNQIGRRYDSEKKLIEIFNKAIKTTNYYRNKYSQIHSLRVFLDGVGFIEKKDVLIDLKDYISDNINKSEYIEGTTGGTSGRPMQFLIPKNRYSFELSAVHSFWNRVGWNYNIRAVIRNHKLPEEKVYKINPITKEIIFDAFRMDRAYAREVFLTLKKHKIEYIQSYPSAAFLFCSLCKELDLDLKFIKAFLTSSEPVLDFQIKLIETELGIPIFNFYGHSEKLIIGGYCEKTKDIHFEPSYGYAELIDSDGQVINEVGKIGELVGTSFNNSGMPLIRFKTGDFAEYVGHKCLSCDREGLIVKNIEGHHSNNLIYKSDGTYTSSTALNLHSHLLLKIDGMQYIQNEKGHLKVLIIKNETFIKKNHDEFYEHFKVGMGNESTIEIEYVRKLVSLPNGKFPLLISSLNL